MPPIHPAIVHYPIALVTLSVIADLLGSIGGNCRLVVAAWRRDRSGVGTYCRTVRHEPPDIDLLLEAKNDK